MPIEIDFEKEEKDRKECENEIARVEQLIIEFLKENKGKAFTELEIISLSKIKSKEVYPGPGFMISDPRHYVIDDLLLKNEHISYRYGTTPEGKSEQHFYYCD